VPTTRLETFADGVFAIAATLLVLNIELPSGGGGGLAHELAHLWPAYTAYAVSFLTIGIIWVNHHAILHLVAQTDRAFLFVNVFFLLTVAFLPFPTRVLAGSLRGGDARAAAVLYGIASLLMAVGFSAVWQYVRRRGLLAADADERIVSGISRSFWPGIPLYATATLLALASAWASAAMYAAIALFYVVSSASFAERPGRAA
jgi:uncharacterized membrane protein